MYVLNGEPYKAKLQSELFIGPMILLVMGGILLDKKKSGKFIVDVNGLFRNAAEKSGEDT